MARHHEAQQYQAAQERARQAKEAQAKFVERANDFGIDEQQYTLDAQVVSMSGVSPQLQDVLVMDEQGPLLVNHLANNPDELAQVRNLSTKNPIWLLCIL